MGISAALIGSVVGSIGSAVAGAGSAVIGGLGAAGSAIGGGLGAAASAAGGAGSLISGASSLVSGGLGIAGALNPPKPPAPMMAPPVQAIPNPPKNTNSSFAALATPSNLTNFGAPNSGRTKTLLGQ